MSWIYEVAEADHLQMELKKQKKECDTVITKLAERKLRTTKHNNLISGEIG